MHSSPPDSPSLAAPPPKPPVCLALALNLVKTRPAPSGDTASSRVPPAATASRLPLRPISQRLSRRRSQCPYSPSQPLQPPHLLRAPSLSMAVDHGQARVTVCSLPFPLFLHLLTRVFHQASENPPPISPPRNFVHITHTGPEHFAKIDTATENDLLTEFSAVRAAQSPRRTLLGIKVGSLSTRNSTRNSMRNSVAVDTEPSMAGSTRSSYYATTKPPTTPVTPTSGHHRSLRSKSSFSLPFREEDGRRTPSRASMSSRNGMLATPVEELPPLPPSNFTSARVSVCLDDYEELEREQQWCHAVTTNTDDGQSIRSEGIALTTDEPVPSPASAAFPPSASLPPPLHFHGRGRSPARSDKSFRSTNSLPVAPRPRVSIVEPPKSVLKPEPSGQANDGNLRARMKRSSLHGGLFSSWHADSDSDDEPLDTIAEDPQDQEQMDDIQEQFPSLEVPADETAKRDSSPLPLIIPTDSPPMEPEVQVQPEEDVISVIEDEAEVPAEFPTVEDEPALEPESEPQAETEESDAESDITAIEVGQPAVLDAVAIESQSGRRVVTTPEELKPRRIPQRNADKRATVVIGALEDGEKDTREGGEDHSGRRSVPLRKNSGKTVRFKEDLVSFIREEVARRNQPTPEQSAGQVQASLEDLEATLARLEAEIAAGPERNEKPTAPKIVEPEVEAAPRPVQAIPRARPEGSPAPRAVMPKGKRPLSESYEKHPSSLRARGRRPERVSPSRGTGRSRRASYDDVHELDPTSPGDEKFFDTMERQH